MRYVALWIRRLGAASSLWKRHRCRDGEGWPAVQTSAAQLLGPGRSNTRDGRCRPVSSRLHVVSCMSQHNSLLGVSQAVNTDTYSVYVILSSYTLPLTVPLSAAGEKVSKS